MAAPTLQAQGALNAITTGNLSITLPAYAANDIVVITTVGWVPNTTTGTNTQSLSSPWTKYSPDITTITGGIIDAEYACWWARATSASSLGSTVTITRPTSWDTGTDTCWGGRAYVIRGCVTTGNPYDEFTGYAISTAANPVLPAVTVAGGNRLALIFMVKADNTATPTAATGYTVGTEATDTAGTDCAAQTYRQTTSANLTTVTPTGGTAPAQGGSVYFEFAFIPDPVTASAAAPLGGLSGSGTATVSHAASAASTLGGLVGAASASPKRFAVLAAPLGGLVGSASAAPQRFASAAASLGGLAGSGSAVVADVAVAAASLGGLVGSASAAIAIPAVAAAPLGGLLATADEAPLHYATAEAQLGGLVAVASSTPTVPVVASSSFGSLVSVASATVEPGPNPPEPTPSYPQPGNPWYRKPQVVPVERVEEPVVVPAIVTASGSCSVSFVSSARAEVTWSILEDEAELLLLM